MVADFHMDGKTPCVTDSWKIIETLLSLVFLIFLFLYLTLGLIKSQCTTNRSNAIKWHSF